MIERGVGRKAQINHLPDQPGDVPLTFADIRKAGEFLGYVPETVIAMGIRKYLDWLATCP